MLSKRNEIYISTLFVLLLFITQACSPKVPHQDFHANRYVPDYSLHVYNDSLQMHFYGPADIEYSTDPEVLKARASGEEWMKKMPLLIYGKTNTPPYEILVFASDKPLVIPKGAYHLYDTLLGGHYIYFMGAGLDPKARLAVESDTRRMFESLVVGEGYNRQISSIFRLMNRFSNSHKYLYALQTIRNYPEYDSQESSMKYQMELTYSSFLGTNEIYSALRRDFESKRYFTEETKKVLKNKGWSNEEALQKILEETKDQRIVMFNENHFYPEHRILVAGLLPDLKAQGYNYLALEALGAGEDSVLNQPNTSPVLATGFYTREQQFDWLLRSAKQLGFQFVAYDSREADRESEQANNLYDATFGHDQEARVVVLAGLDHIFEKSGPDDMVRMAEIFRTRFNINPLTISQSQLFDPNPDVDITYQLVRSSDLPERFHQTDFQLINLQPNEAQYEHALMDFTNSFGKNIQVAHFMGDVEDNPNLLEGHVPYFSTIIPRSETKEIPLIKGHTTIRIIYDEFGNELEWRAIPDPLLNGQ